MVKNYCNIDIGIYLYLHVGQQSLLYKNCSVNKFKTLEFTVSYHETDLPTSGNQKLYSVIPEQLYFPQWELYFIIKTIFWGEKKHFWARSAHHEREVLSAGVQGPIRALEAHGF